MRRLTARVYVSGLGVLLFGTIGIASLMAQSYYGSLRGLIRDPNGSVVPTTRVTLTDENTNVSRQTIASGDGEYAFNQVVPSTYTVIAEAAGFKRFERKGVL